MHTSLRVTGVLSGVQSSVVLGLGLRGRASPEPVHQPAFVVPGHPCRCDVLQVGEGADRTGAERGALADTLGLIQPYRRLAQRIIERVADGPDRRDQPFKHQRLAVMYCGVLTRFKRSTQHLNDGGAFDGTTTRLGGSVDGAGGDAVAGSASGTSGSRTRLLGADRAWAHK